LTVTVVRASQLASAASEVEAAAVLKPYVVIEVDEPSQKYKTNPAAFSQNLAQWNEDCIL
jgi:hypothetical protein